MWELPSEELSDGEDVGQGRRRLAARLRVIGRIDAKPVGEVTRLLTHRRVTFTVFRGQSAKSTRIQWIGGQSARWVRGDAVGGLGVSRAGQAVLALVMD